MRIKLSKATRPFRSADLDSLEERIGFALPADYKRFLASHNGATLQTNVFSVSASNDSGVNSFIPLDELEKERRHIEEEVPKSAIPVAWAEGGNYVVLDVRQGGGVFFWDHESPTPLTRLADSFDAFLEMLQPFDVNSVELKPGQVKSVWIDPSLLNEN